MELSNLNPLLYIRSKNCEVCPSSLDVAFAEGVYEYIVGQVRKCPGYETGGMLFGHIDGNSKRTVLAATPPGPAAKQNKFMYGTDAEYSQYLINELSVHLSLVYLGEWHKHPEGYCVPSGGDEKGCLCILQDPDYQIEGILLFPIFTMSRQGAVAPHYYFMDNTLRYGEFKPHTIKERNYCDFVDNIDATYRAKCISANVLWGGRGQDYNSESIDIMRPSQILATPLWYQSTDGKHELARIAESLKILNLKFTVKRRPNGDLIFRVLVCEGICIGIAVADDHPLHRPKLFIEGAELWSLKTNYVSHIIIDTVASIERVFCSRSQTHINVEC